MELALQNTPQTPLSITSKCPPCTAASNGDVPSASATSTKDEDEEEESVDSSSTVVIDDDGKLRAAAAARTHSHTWQ